MRERYINKSVKVMYELIDNLKNTNQASHHTLAIYDYLISLRNNNTRYSMCSYNKIHKMFNYSVNTIIKSIKFLEEYGYLFVVRSYHQTNKYFMPFEDIVLDNGRIEQYPTIIQACGGNVNEWYEYVDKFLIDYRKDIVI